MDEYQLITTVSNDLIGDNVLVLAWTYQYGTRLRFVAIKISTDLEEANLGYSKGLPIRDEWEDFLTNEVSPKAFDSRRVT